MSTYLILITIVAILYFFVVRKKETPKTDYENLPDLCVYKKLKKALNAQGNLCCRHCSHEEFNERSLVSKTENPLQNKFYFSCAKCRVILYKRQS